MNDDALREAVALIKQTLGDGLLAAANIAEARGLKSGPVLRALVAEGLALAAESYTAAGGIDVDVFAEMAAVALECVQSKGIKQ